MSGESFGTNSKGSKGSKGSQGSAGSIGSKGSKKSEGSDGSQSSKGSKGSKGSQGIDITPESGGSPNAPGSATAEAQSPTQPASPAPTSATAPTPTPAPKVTLKEPPGEVVPKADEKDKTPQKTNEKEKTPEKADEKDKTPEKADKVKSADKALEKPEAIIIDFFGTTTTRKLVADVLLPFISQEIDNFLKEKWSDKTLQSDITFIRKHQTKKPSDFPQKVKESNEPEEEVRKSIVDYIKTNIEKKKNHVGANRLMKRIWCDGYEKGKLKTPIYEDVVSVLEKWKQQNIKMYSFSSNAAASQKLFYKVTDRGDLLPFFTDFFDRSTGKKDSVESYRKIATKISIPGNKILYVNDAVREAKVAKKAELKNVLIIRSGNREIKEKYKKTFTCVQSFAEIQFPE